MPSIDSTISSSYWLSSISNPNQHKKIDNANIPNEDQPTSNELTLVNPLQQDREIVLTS